MAALLASDVTPARDSLRTADRDLAAAAKVLRLEADALVQLSRALDGRFVEAVEALDGIAGRVIVTGMGKSGHVARKIAATLASTGKPAFFVHPAEASHGDLGMITPNDAVLALSNSGRTAELSAIIAYTRRFRIPLVAFTAEPASPLGEAADIVIPLAPAAEACPMGLAPTTSTTMMLALGDALSVALLQRRGFSESDFHRLHPGGKLGQQLLHVSEIMHGAEELPLVAPETPMAEAILEMTAKRFGCVGIVAADGRLAGIITDGDLRRHMGPDLMQLAAGTVMTPDPKTIRPQSLAAEALAIMNERRITTLFAVTDGRPEGILHIHDCLRAGIA